MFEPNELEYPNLTLPKPQGIPARHPFNNQVNHDALLKYVKARLNLGKERRDEQLGRFVTIDRTVAGWIRHKNEDAKRQLQRTQNGAAVAVSQHLPLTWVHLDDMMTYYAGVFAPNRGMFYATSKPKDATQTGQLITLMNNHAIYAGYYREVLSSIYSLLKYNVGGFHLHWSKSQGPKLVRGDNGKDTLTSETIWEGNRVEAVDMYNFIADPNCDITKLHEDGEFAGEVKIRSRYWLQQKCIQGLFFNCEKAMRSKSGIETQAHVYYRNPPSETNIANATGGAVADGVQVHTDWMKVLSTQADHQQKGHELATVYIRIDPTMFGLIGPLDGGLSSRKRYETWRITILDGQYIIEAQYMNNIHGHLPYYMGLMTADQLGDSQKSNAEIIAPLQDLASFMMNLHVQAMRKRLHGTTLYDPSAVDLKAVPDGEVAAKVPLKPSAAGRDIRTIVHEMNNGPETRTTMQDLQGVMELINMFFPTQALPSQVAGIDRAVTNQVAAVIQGANRRQLMRARLLDDTLFKHVRFGMYYNIIQYQPDQTNVVDFYTGSQVQIDLNSLRNTELPFVIGQGLKALDKESVENKMQNLIFAVLQSQRANEQIDIVGMMDFWVKMMDIDVDMEQFRIQPQAQPRAGGVNGPGITPATGSEGLAGGPIYSEQAAA
mgnify:CR=1 FL=1